MADNEDPFNRPNATILRPRPGAGRRGVGDLGTQAVPSQSHRPPAPPAAPASGAAPAAGPLGSLPGPGLNPLVEAASPLLLLAGHLRGTLSAPDLQGLRRHVVDEIRRFEERARAAGVGGDIVLAARYAICACIDEAVLSTPWGAHSDWAQQTLLVVLHREAWGGEKFFEMLERTAREPARFIDLMELQYLCIAFGFAGKYQVLDRGHVRLAEVQQELYRNIRSYRGAPPPDLSPRWQGVRDTRNRLIKYVPWWVVGAAALAILALTFIGYYSWLASRGGPVHAALANIGREDFTGPAPAPVAVAGPTLKQLLAPEEARGLLTVEEQGSRTTVTLQASELFRSGSATPSPAFDDVLRRVARAINQVPGRVMVVGHTDDQPVQSLRFANNFELSRERATSVVRLLARDTDPARLESTGVGSSEPRYRPESQPENRARNRRVEIVHIP